MCQTGEACGHAPIPVRLDTAGRFLVLSLRWANALYVPPFKRKFVMRSATAWERIGLKVGIGVPGVFIVDAQKQVFAAVRGEPEKRLAPALEPVPLQASRAQSTPRDAIKT